MTRPGYDVVGAVFNRVLAPVACSRSEYHLELFYRFQVVDTALSDQSVINPALTREVDQASVFSLRFRTAF